MSVIDNMKSSSSLVYCGSVRRRRRPERKALGSTRVHFFLDRGGDRDITWGYAFFSQTAYSCKLFTNKFVSKQLTAVSCLRKKCVPPSYIPIPTPIQKEVHPSRP